MNGRHPSDDRGPWFSMAGQAIYSPVALVGVGILSMLVTSIAATFKIEGFQSFVVFSSEAILRRYEVWRLVTYVLWNPPNLWFVINMFMLWWFGRELEVFFGRRVFLKLCVGLILVPSICGVLVGTVTPVSWGGMPGNFSLFVAYATMLPGVSWFFGVTAMWMAITFLGIQMLAFLTEHDWSGMVLALSGAAFAFSYVRIQQGIWELPQMPGSLLPAKKPQFRVLEPVPHPEKTRSGGVPVSELEGLEDLEEDLEDVEVLEAVDSLLEKIARSGMASLTENEKQQLQHAREALLRREGSNH
jgi:hypothetical protein